MKVRNYNTDVKNSRFIDHDPLTLLTTGFCTFAGTAAGSTSSGGDAVTDEIFTISDLKGTWSDDCLTAAGFSGAGGVIFTLSCTLVLTSTLGGSALGGAAGVTTGGFLLGLGRESRSNPENRPYSGIGSVYIMMIGLNGEMLIWCEILLCPLVFQ
jgi:hypothetical protein